MTIKKLLFALLLTLLTPLMHASLFTRLSSLGNRFNIACKERVGSMIWKYNVCKVYDRQIPGATTARTYRNVIAGSLALGTGIIGGISYGGYRLIKHQMQARTKLRSC
jgi:hypothetical protein